MSFSDNSELRESFIEIITSENCTISDYKGFTIETNNYEYHIYYDGDLINKVKDPEQILRWFEYKEQYKDHLNGRINCQDLSFNGWKYYADADCHHKWATHLDEHEVKITHNMNGSRVKSPHQITSINSVSPKAAFLVAIDAISQNPAHELDYEMRINNLARTEFKKLDDIGGSRSGSLVRNDITTFEELIDAPNYKLPDKVPAKALKKRAKEYLEENERDIDETPQIREVSSYYVSRSI